MNVVDRLYDIKKVYEKRVKGENPEEFKKLKNRVNLKAFASTSNMKRSMMTRMKSTELPTQNYISVNRKNL